MNERNPFAPPKSSVEDVQQTDCSRQGKSVLVPAGADLPPRCIVCNEPAQQPVKKTRLYWHSSWLYLLVLVNLLLYAIIAVIVRKSVQVSPGLCAAHATRRRRRMGIPLGLAALAIASGCCLLFGEPGSEPGSEAGLAAVALFIVAVLLLFVAGVVGRKVRAREITAEKALLDGCKEPFLASLERGAQG